jgi:hypothetical protein
MKVNALETETDEIETVDDELIWKPKTKNTTSDTTDNLEEGEDTTTTTSEITELKEKENWKNKANLQKREIPFVNKFRLKKTTSFLKSC